MQAPIIIEEGNFESPACALDAPDGANDLERRVWNDICYMGKSDASGTIITEDACTAGDTPLENLSPTTLEAVTLSLRFLTQILTTPEYIAHWHIPRVTLRCFMIPHINLEYQKVGGSVRIENSVLGSVWLYRAAVEGDFFITSSSINDGVHAQSLDVKGNLSFRFTEFADEIDLLDLKVEGYLSLNGAHVSGELDLNRAKIGKDLLMREEASFADINLLSATIRGQLNLRTSTVAGPIIAEKIRLKDSLLMEDAMLEAIDLQDARVGGSVRFDRATVNGQLSGDRAIVHGKLDFSEANMQRVRLLNMTIGCSLIANGATFNKLLSGEGLIVKRAIYLRSDYSNGQKLSSFQNVDFTDARIGQHLQLHGSSFAGYVNLTEAKMGSLLLWQGTSLSGKRPAIDVTWLDGSRLILRNATAGSLQARMPSNWMREDGNPLPVDLNGFRYDRLGGYSSGAENDLASVHVPAMLEWIENSNSRSNTGYTPQPYRALQNALENLGAEAAGREVAYARLKHRAQTRLSVSPTEHFGLWLYQFSGLIWDRFLQVTVGFGVYPQYALIWFVGLVSAGTLIARRSEKICSSGKMDCFWYSLENAIPLIEPSEDHKIQHAEKRIRSFFHFQKVAGFVLASVLIGTLSLSG